MEEIRHRGPVRRNVSNDSISLLVPLGGDLANGNGKSAKIGSPSSSNSPLPPGPARRSPNRISSISHPTKRPRNSTSSFSLQSNCFMTFLKFIFCISIGAGGAYHYSQRLAHREHSRIVAKLQKSQAAAQGYQTKLKDLEEVNRKLKEENQSLAVVVSTTPPAAAQNKSAVDLQEMKELSEKVVQLVDYKKRMHQSIQQMSKKIVLEKFGPGPHRVEIIIAFDPESNIRGDDARILIELAPLDLMPHAVFTFLNQVELKLYDFASFHRNANHVLQAGPVNNFLTPSGMHLRQQFEKSGFQSVLFQEYSEAFPHEQYTLGYAGRPGGPDFYFSLRDNVRNHGPGGQAKYNDPGEADPCFAKVIDGVEAIQRMHHSEVRSGEYHRMKHFVAIRSMRIVKDNDARAA